MHFIRATRQDVSKPARAFHTGDFEYLHDKFFFNKSMVLLWCLLVVHHAHHSEPHNFLFSFPVVSLLLFAMKQVSMKDFDQFWNWFGKGLHILRYQRHVGNLWKSGLIFGFIAKDAVHAALANQRYVALSSLHCISHDSTPLSARFPHNSVGSFLVRFSENHAGSFAVAYKHLEEVKHYLVKADDFAGPKKTLPDFLNECPQVHSHFPCSCSLFSHTFL